MSPVIHRYLLPCLGLLVVGYCAVCLLVYSTQSSMIYYPDFPSRELLNTPADVGLKYEDIMLKTEDSVKLHGWYLPAKEDRASLLFFHGNAGNISHRIRTLLIFNRLGLNVLIIDYRGYGKSEGKPSERGTYLDAEAAWNYLIQVRGVEAGQVLLFGRSLGGAIASRLARNREALGLVIESSFTSVPDFASEIYPFLPVRLLSRYRYDNRNHLKQVDIPVMIGHSPGDEIIPFTQGEQLYASAGSDKRFYTLRGGHNDGIRVGQESYFAIFDDFIDHCVSLR